MRWRTDCFTMVSMMRIALICLSASLPLMSLAEVLSYSLDYETWSRPRDGQTVRELNSVGDAIMRWQSNPKSTIDIRYPGGEAGSLWASELKDWMVSFGVPSERIQLTPGSASPGLIDIDVQRPLTLQ